MTPAHDRLRRGTLAAAVVGAVLILAAGMASAQGQSPAAQAPAAGPAPSSVPVMSAAQRLRDHAIEDEKNLKLADALMRWKFLLAIDPKHAEAAARIPVLQQQIDILADTHFQRGAGLFRKKQREDALREFLAALTFNPEHAEALDYIRVKLKPADWVYYTTVAGDTMKVVAKKAYQDEKKDFLVWSYNDLSRDAGFTPGTVLKLPIIESDLRRPSVNVVEVLGKAKSMLEQGQFDEAISSVEGILVYDAGNAMARELMNAAYYRQAKDLAAQNKPFEAMTAFKNVDPGYKDTKDSMAALQSGLKSSAEEHYKKGVEMFIKENLDGAITEWELTLRIDPAHPKAKQDLDNAKQLRDRLQQVQR